MRELTIYDLDAQLAEPLPDRELMSLLALSSVTQNALAVANNGADTITQGSAVGANVADVGNTTVAVALNLFS